jgi:hypothetical protein
LEKHIGSISTRNHHEAGSKQNSSRSLLYAGFLLGLIFNPADDGDMALRNVGCLITGYAVLYPRFFITIAASTAVLPL